MSGTGSWTLRVDEIHQAGRRPSPLAWSLLGLTCLLGVGTAGYVLIEGWSWLDGLYMAVITLTTIGFGEVQPLSDGGRMFTIAYIVGFLGLGMRGVTETARYIADGRFAADMRTRTARRELSTMKNHYIVVGYGRLGREIVADLVHHGAEVVVIDQVDVGVLPDGVHLIVGDASLDEVLVESGIERARALAVATASDAVNVYITLSARQLNPTLPIQTRVEEDAAAVKARRAGASGVVLPFQLGGARVAASLLRPHSSAFVQQVTERHHSDLLMEDVFVREGSTLKGSLRELSLRGRFGVSVVAVQRGEGLVYPDADTQIGAGDILVVVGPPDEVRRFVEAAG